MRFLLDTNVVSEWVKPRPDAGVVQWLTEVDEDEVFISAVTIAEIRHGIQRMARGVRRDRLDLWLSEELPVRFDARVLPIDAQVADEWGRVMARSQEIGRPAGVMDAFVAATTKRHDLTLATRNVTDFEALGIQVVNPWRNA